MCDFNSTQNPIINCERILLENLESNDIDRDWVYVQTIRWLIIQ